MALGETDSLASEGTPKDSNRKESPVETRASQQKNPQLVAKVRYGANDYEVRINGAPEKFLRREHRRIESVTDNDNRIEIHGWTPDSIILATSCKQRAGKSATGDTSPSKR